MWLIPNDASLVSPLCLNGLVYCNPVGRGTSPTRPAVPRAPGKRDGRATEPAPRLMPLFSHGPPMRLPSPQSALLVIGFRDSAWGWERLSAAPPVRRRGGFSPAELRRGENASQVQVRRSPLTFPSRSLTPGTRPTTRLHSHDPAGFCGSSSSLAIPRSSCFVLRWEALTPRLGRACCSISRWSGVLTNGPVSPYSAGLPFSPASAAAHSRQTSSQPVRPFR